jgi:2-polyprenyl-3-methyl-5-hydroxy-6-metoxy-1,4-benzoquinol methylase
VTGKYHTVTCLDVMIHYPQDKADAMIEHLASLAEQRLIVSFAPKTPYYSVLKRIGELFPGPSKVRRSLFDDYDYYDDDWGLTASMFVISVPSVKVHNYDNI